MLIAILVIEVVIAVGIWYVVWNTLPVKSPIIDSGGWTPPLEEAEDSDNVVALTDQREEQWLAENEESL